MVKIIPLQDVDHHLQDDSPATKFVKTTIYSEECVIFTDSPFRDIYKQTKTILNVLEQKWKPVELHHDDHKEHKSGIEAVLNRITNNAPPPHMFYKQKYYASGSKITNLYAYGQLEHTLGLESTVVH